MPRNHVVFATTIIGGQIYHHVPNAGTNSTAYCGTTHVTHYIGTTEGRRECIRCGQAARRRSDDAGRQVAR